jgi:hypothetical protein
MIRIFGLRIKTKKEHEQTNWWHRMIKIFGLRIQTQKEYLHCKYLDELDGINNELLKKPKDKIG